LDELRKLAAGRRDRSQEHTSITRVRRAMGVAALFEGIEQPGHGGPGDEHALTDDVRG
jgi:hypothetical protein